MSALVASLSSKLSTRLGMEGGDDLVNVLKATAFKGQVSDAQMSALLIVANQYGLNPWTKEIYAFPDKNNGIVPVVGVDGWSRIINEHQQFDGLEFRQDDESCTCIIHRKDRGHPTSVTEYMSECRRGAGPWQSHPKRMLRHKALIQCARLAFGYTGIFDQDEAERIIERDMGKIDRETGEVTRPAKAALPACDDALIQKMFAQARAGKGKPEGIEPWLAAKYTLTPSQIEAVREFVEDMKTPPIDGDFIAAIEAAEEGDEA